MSAHIAVIDDDPMIRDLLSAVLTQEGYQVTARDSVAGLAAVLADPPDLLLLDWLMPLINGPQVAAVVRAHPPTATVPVVILTAYLDAERHFTDCRIAAYLHKPFPIAELIALVRRLVPNPGGDPCP